MRTLIIGDIHGCSGTFRKMVQEEMQLQKDDQLFLLGDYIDRGPDSKGVVDFILELRQKGFQVRTLRGNHEQLLIESANSKMVQGMWLNNGGVTTLESFGIKSVLELDPVYQQFFLKTEFYVETKDFILVHASLNFKAEDPLQDKMAMMWLREYKDENNYMNGRILIHGHTPKKGVFIRSQEFKSPFNLDGGCVYKDISSMGSLFGLSFYEQKLFEVPVVDAVKSKLENL